MKKARQEEHLFSMNRLSLFPCVFGGVGIILGGMFSKIDVGYIGWCFPFTILYSKNISANVLRKPQCHLNPVWYPLG